MKPAVVLLSSSLVFRLSGIVLFFSSGGRKKKNLTSSFRSLLGILLISLLFCNGLTAQTDTTKNNILDTGKKNSTDTLKHITNEEIMRPLTVLTLSDLAKIDFSGDSSSVNTKKRTWLVGAGNVIGYGGIMTALAAAWYDDYTKTKLHSFNDSKEWLQVDKVGHFYGTWIESRANHELWKWTGMEKKKRIWISGLTSFLFQTTIEYLDGKSAEWGWSWSDFGANILGSGTFIAQELAWDDQRIKLKWSFHRKHYDDASLNQRSDELFGKSSPERFLKDYNGQTYWASINLRSFLPDSKIPAWLSVAVGYGGEGMFGGTENFAKDINGNITFNRPDIKRYRQWYLAPDIDLSKIKTKSKAINFLFTVLSAFKFPLPSIEFSNGKFRTHAIHF